MSKKRLFSIILIILLIFQSTLNVFATNETVAPTYDLLQQGINMPLADPLMNDMTLKNTILVDQPLPTDILSYNANILNNSINNFQTEQIIQPIDLTLEQMNNPTMDLLDSTMKDLEELDKDKKTIITGYLYKYVETNISQEEIDTETENEQLTDTTETTENVISESVSVDNTESTTTPETEEIIENKEEKNLNKEEKIQKKSTEYYTIVNKTEYIQLVPNDEVLKEAFKLIAGKDVLLEFVGHLQEDGSLLVVYVSCVDELPEEILSELKKIEEKLNKISTKKGVFIEINEKVYFLEKETDEIYAITTEIDIVEEVIFYLTNKGTITEVEVLEEEDYLNIYSITIPDNELSEEEIVELELMLLFNTSKVYNFTSKIYSSKIEKTEETIYFVKVDNKEYILNTMDEKIGDIIVANANKEVTVYMEGYIGKKADYLFYVTYIEIK